MARKIFLLRQLSVSINHIKLARETNLYGSVFHQAVSVDVHIVIQL